MPKAKTPVISDVVDPKNQCAPDAQGTFRQFRTCFGKSALQQLVAAWNKAHPDEAITGSRGMSVKALWNALDARMRRTNVCAPGEETCWVDALRTTTPDVTRRLRPPSPHNWKRDPNTWLTNYDIEAVMKQYDRAFKSYAFLGVFPVNFNETSVFGKCLHTQLCELPLKPFLKRGITSLGIVINLDRYGEPGSHWTSLFAIIDPKKPNAGAYYFDSVGHAPPKEMATFMKALQKQALMLAPPTMKAPKFRLAYNPKPFQKTNTECGMFAILHQLKWMEELQRDPDVAVETVWDAGWTDAWVTKHRSTLFRTPGPKTA